MLHFRSARKVNLKVGDTCDSCRMKGTPTITNFPQSPSSDDVCTFPLSLFDAVFKFFLVLG